MSEVPQYSNSQIIFNGVNRYLGKVAVATQGTPVSGAIDTGQTAGEIVGGVITTIGTISNQAEQENFMSAFKSLSNQDQLEIGKKMLQANDQEQKLNILIKAMITAKINDLQNKQSNKKKIAIVLNLLIFPLIVFFKN
ncbi:MAG: hypothetical protein ACRDE2_00265 [Chitinophagaceae bacterium]